MSGETAERPREVLARLAERFHLTKPTLRLIAQAADPSLTDTAPPDEAQITKVIEAIELFVLSGLDSDPLITAAITRLAEEGGERWRDQLWSDLLASAGAEWDRRGRPEDPLGRHLTTVAPIPPQPAEEIDPAHQQAA